MFQAIGEHIKRRDGLFAITPGAGDGLPDRVVFRHQRHGGGKIGVLLIAFFQHAPPETAFFFRTAREGEQNGQGDFALAEIITHGLAKGGLIGGVIQRVIHQLEGNAKRAAIITQRGLFGCWPISDHRAHFGGGGEKGGRFAFNHRQILVFRGGGIILRHQLQHFTFGNRRRGGGQDAQHFKRPIRHHQLKSAGKQEIAHQHGRLIAK